MIRLREATMLAVTKLRTRKVRLVVTIVISGLLFGVLAGASIGARGVFSSIASFNHEGLSSRFLVQGNSLSSGNVFMDKSIIDRAAAIYKETIEAKKAEAKKLGIEYNSENDRPPYNEYPGSNGTKIRTIDPTQPAAIQAVKEYSSSHPQPGINEFKKAAGSYHASASYESRTIPYDTSGSQLKVLKGGKETYDDTKPTAGNGPVTGLDSFATNWSLMSEDLLRPFILPGESLAVNKDGSIPIIIPISAAEQLLGAKALPSSASANDRLERTRQNRQSIQGFTFDACYRNATSAALINRAVTVQQEIEENKNKKDYQKPSLQYGLPAEACGPATVIRDVRTAEQKTLDAKQLQFDQKFGATESVQSKIHFRVVGMVPDADYSVSTNVSQIIKSLVTSSLGNGWYAPLSAARQNQTVNQLFFQANTQLAGSSSYFADFKTADAARTFIDQQNCTPDYQKYDPTSGDDPAQACIGSGKPFGLGPYGSNSLGLESAKQTFQKFFTLVGLGIAVVACVIMMGTVGKMIADSRRETAVFRAIGAKKLDIAQIYVLYTIFLSTLVFLFAMAAGLAAAVYADHRWASDATQQALVAYNAQDLSKAFKLYALYPPDMLYLLGITVAAGLLSAVFPLVRSLRRNPIRDMRDDT